MSSLVYKFDEVSSTNDVAKDFADKHYDEYSVIVASSQTAGRGRNGRTWVSPSNKGLYMSMLLRPQIDISRLPSLTLVTGIATCDTIAEVSQCHTGIKWPNDIIINGRKVAGILCELHTTQNNEHCMIIGVGVNVNTLPQELPVRPIYPATSLYIETGKQFDLDKLIESWVSHMKREVQAFYDGNAFHQKWNKLNILENKNISIDTPDQGIVKGICLGCDDTGLLLIKEENKDCVTKVICGSILP